jgi:hypothetical protein
MADLGDKGMTGLDPCPFCGCAVVMTQRGQNELTIKCIGCAVTRTQKVLRESIDWLRGKMTEHWNTRAQSEYLFGCQLRGPGECQKEGKCLSASCVNYGKETR